MIGRTRHRLPLRIAIIATGIIMVSVEAIAAGRLSGRYVLTYQDSRGTQFNSESFLQHYEATLRDRLFETTALSASIFFDNLKTLTTDRTIRRYRGEINLAHRLVHDHEVVPASEIWFQAGRSGRTVTWAGCSGRRSISGGRCPGARRSWPGR